MNSAASRLAHKVKEIATPEIKLTARPFDIFRPDETVWWLIPSTDWPAFKFGKLFFDPKLPTGTVNPDSVFSGFYIEKGLGSALSAIDGYDPSWIMGHDWLWRTFVMWLGSDAFALPKGSLLAIYASFFPPREKHGIRDPVESLVAHKTNFKASWASFFVEPGRKLRLNSMELNPANPEIASHFRKGILPATDISGISATLLEFPQADWIWIDVMFGSIANRDTQVEQLWRGHLRY